MNWVTQGRQEHGWFGSGSAPTDADTVRGKVDVAAYGAVAGQKTGERRAYSSMLERGGLDRLRALIPIWAAAQGDVTSFDQHYFGGQISHESADLIRIAAKAILGAQTRQESIVATNLLSDAIKTIGVDRIGTVLAAAEKTQAPPSRAKTEDLRADRPVPFSSELDISADKPRQAKAASNPGVPVVLPNGLSISNVHTGGVMMSPVADLSPVAKAGKQVGETFIILSDNPETSAGAPAYLIAELGLNLGHAAKFDYQRSGNMITGYIQLRQFRDVSNFNVGLFCQQAGLTLSQTLQISGLYARLASSNAAPSQPDGLDPRTAEFTKLGYEAGANGIFNSENLN